MKRIKNTKITSFFIEEFKKEKELLEIFFGKMLGDGNLHIGGALRFCHSGKQKEYIEYCYKLFEKYTTSPIKSVLRQKKGSENTNEELYFSTRSIFKEYLDIFYVTDEVNKTRTKILPKNIEEYITPISLAFWIMDDGMRNHNQLGLCTHSFTKEENLLLIKILTEKFNFNCKLHIQKDKRYPDKVWYFIRIYNVEVVWGLVKKWITPSMYYKFGKYATMENNISLDFEKINLNTSIQVDQKNDSNSTDSPVL